MRFASCLWFIRYCLLWIPFLLALIPPPVIYAGSGKVLIVHSYHETQAGHVVEMAQGLNQALSACAPDIRYFYMDTKRKHGPEWKTTAGQMAKDLVASYHPDVVIAMDDNAQIYFAKDYAGKPGAPRIVFGGINAEPEIYGYPADNVTGVIERPNVRESIDLLRKIVPEVKTMVLISDKSPTTDPFHDYVRQMDLPVTILAQEQPRTFSEWKAVIENYKDRVDAFGIYVIRTIQSDSDPDKMIPEKELIAYLIDNCDLPTVGFFDAAARDGILCGISVSMIEQGFAAGRMACEILSGKLPRDIPIQPTKRGRIQLNLKTAERLNLPIRYRLIRNAEEVIR